MRILVGYKGERDARPVRIDIAKLQEMWPELSPALMVKRPQDEELAPVPTELEGSELVWIPSPAQVEEDGEGLAQVFFSDESGEVLGKSAVMETEIRWAPGEGGEIPEEPIAPYIASVLAAKAAFDTAKAHVEGELALMDSELDDMHEKLAQVEENADEAYRKAEEAAADASAAKEAAEQIPAIRSELAGKASQTALEAEAARATAEEARLANAVNGKQDKLVAGSNITINGNVISAQGGGAGYDDTEVRRMIAVNEIAIGENADEIEQLKNDLTELADNIPTKLPNPNALTFTGAVNATYDGSAPVTVDIPQGGIKPYRKYAEFALEEATTSMYVGDDDMLYKDIIVVMTVGDNSGESANGRLQLRGYNNDMSASVLIYQDSAPWITRNANTKTAWIRSEMITDTIRETNAVLTTTSNYPASNVYTTRPANNIQTLKKLRITMSNIPVGTLFEIWIR